MTVLAESNQSPRVSIIINCYNGAKYLLETIESVLTQTFSDFEIIFWDNQSIDESASIVNKINDSRMRYFYAPNHTTLGEARNLAVLKARGEWIAFIDCDDLWVPTKLSDQLAIIDVDQNEDLGLVYGRTSYLGGPNHGRELAPKYQGKRLPEGQILEPLLMEGNFIPILSALIRRDCYWAVGGIPENFRQAEDYYLFAAIATRYRIRALQTICGFYRIHDNNLSFLQRTLNYEECIDVINKFWPLVKGGTEKLRRRIINEFNVMAGISLVIIDHRYWDGVKRLSASNFFTTIKVLSSIGYRQVERRFRSET